ncbi:MAG: GNAT family N-acetyltransferase [Ferruginibacter sp.]
MIFQMETQHQQTNRKGSFFLEQNNKQVALMTYHLSESTMVIEHTEVDPSLQGENIGMQLVNAAVNYARDNKMKIKPLCSFVASVLNKDKDKYADIL